MVVLYHDYTKSLGLSDAAFGLFYSLNEYDKTCTQKDLCVVCFLLFYKFPEVRNINNMEKELIEKFKRKLNNKTNYAICPIGFVICVKKCRKIIVAYLQGRVAMLR